MNIIELAEYIVHGQRIDDKEIQILQYNMKSYNWYIDDNELHEKSYYICPKDRDTCIFVYFGSLVMKCEKDININDCSHNLVNYFYSLYNYEHPEKFASYLEHGKFIDFLYMFAENNKDAMPGLSMSSPRTNNYDRKYNAQLNKGYKLDQIYREHEALIMEEYFTHRGHTVSEVQYLMKIWPRIHKVMVNDQYVLLTDCDIVFDNNKISILHDGQCVMVDAICIDKLPVEDLIYTYAYIGTFGYMKGKWRKSLCDFKKINLV